MQNDEMRETLENTKSTNELANTEFQLKLKILEKEKEEILKRENMTIKVMNVGTIY